MKEITRIITANIEITAIRKINGEPEVTEEDLKKELERVLRITGADDVHVRNVEIKDFEMEVKE